MGVRATPSQPSWVTLSNVSETEAWISAAIVVSRPEYVARDDGYADQKPTKAGHLALWWFISFPSNTGSRTSLSSLMEPVLGKPYLQMLPLLLE